MSDFATQAIHAVPSFDQTTGAVIAPIYQTSTFAAGNPAGFDYTRSGNPNFRQLDAVIAALENAQFATCFAVAWAITAVVSSLDQNAVVLAEENVYGCTYRLFAQVFEKFGITVHYRDLSDPDQWAAIEELSPTLVVVKKVPPTRY